ncbi:hypothetical protein VPH35_022762 [Triticum aestivum]
MSVTFILGIANFVGGLPLIFHNVTNFSQGRPLLTQAWMWSKARLHMVLPLLSHMVFGLLPPVLCGLSFRDSNDRENKMMDVTSASLACIALLALGKVMATKEP